MNIDSAIKLLKKRKEEASRVDPNTTIQGLLSKLNNNLIGAIADIAQAFLETTDKTEITNQPKVSVSNFPKVERIDLSPVVEAIKEIPDSKETDITPVVRAIREIPVPKPVDVSSVVRAINAIPSPDPVNLSPVVKAIKDIPKPEKYPEEIKVKNQVALDKIESMLSQIIKLVNAPKTSSGKAKDEVTTKELRSLFSSLTEAISDAKLTSVVVSNPGDFPVSPGIATFKDINGKVAYGIIDANGNQSSKIIETVPTNESNTNPSLVLGYTSSNLTSITQSIDSVDYRKTFVYDASGNLTNVSEWVQL